jgi:hypothetical protein
MTTDDAKQAEGMASPNALPNYPELLTESTSDDLWSFQPESLRLDSGIYAGMERGLNEAILFTIEVCPLLPSPVAALASAEIPWARWMLRKLAA